MDKKALISILAVAVIAAAIPLTVLLSRQSQDIRQHASSSVLSAKETVNFVSIPRGSTTNAKGTADITLSATDQNSNINITMQGSVTGLTPNHSYSLALYSPGDNNIAIVANNNILADSSGGASLDIPLATLSMNIINGLEQHNFIDWLLTDNSLMNVVYPRNVGAAAGAARNVARLIQTASGLPLTTASIQFSSIAGSPDNAKGTAIITGWTTNVNSAINVSIIGSITGLTPLGTYYAALCPVSAPISKCIDLVNILGGKSVLTTVVADSSGNALLRMTDASTGSVSNLKDNKERLLYLIYQNTYVGSVGASADLFSWISQLTSSFSTPTPTETVTPTTTATPAPNPTAPFTVSMSSVSGGSTTNANGTLTIKEDGQDSSGNILVDISGTIIGLTPNGYYTLSFFDPNSQNVDGIYSLFADTTGNTVLNIQKVSTHYNAEGLKQGNYDYLVLRDLNLRTEHYPAWVGASGDITQWINQL